MSNPSYRSVKHALAPLVILTLPFAASAQDDAQTGDKTQGSGDEPEPRIYRVPPPAPPRLAAPPAPPPPVRSASRPATPSNDPSTWVTTDDYPSRAIRNEADGTVGFRLTVGTDGRVADCDITISSGFAELDEATCALVTRRARFRPARDWRGNPVQGNYGNRVIWQMPPREAIEPEADYELTFIVDETGEVSDCQIVREDGGAEDFRVGCSEGFDYLPILDEEGNPVRRRVRMVYRVTYEEVE